MEQLKDKVDDKIQTVTVNVVFDPKTKEFNGKPVTSRGSYVTWKGVQYSVYFKEKDFPLAVKGAVLNCIKKEYQGNPYLEWYATGDQGQPDAMVQAQAPLPETKYVQQENSSTDKQKFDYKLSFLGNLKMFEWYLKENIDNPEKATNAEVYDKILLMNEALTDKALERINNKYRQQDTQPCSQKDREIPC